MYRIGESQYYYGSSGLYRKVKLTPQGYHIKDKHGKLRWFTEKDLERIVRMTATFIEGEKMEIKHILDNYYEIGGRVFREIAVTDGKCKLHIGDKQVWYRPSGRETDNILCRYDNDRRE